MPPWAAMSRVHSRFRLYCLLLPNISTISCIRCKLCKLVASAVFLVIISCPEIAKPVHFCNRLLEEPMQKWSQDALLLRLWLRWFFTNTGSQEISAQSNLKCPSVDGLMAGRVRLNLLWLFRGTMDGDTKLFQIMITLDWTLKPKLTEFLTTHLFDNVPVFAVVDAAVVLLWFWRIGKLRKCIENCIFRCCSLMCTKKVHPKTVLYLLQSSYQLPPLQFDFQNLSRHYAMIYTFCK